MTVVEVFARYGAALTAGNMEELAAVLSPDIVWHQPGRNPLSGDHVGPAAVIELLSRYMELTEGTFKIETGAMEVNGSLLVAAVHFWATRSGRTELDQHGMDVFRIEGDHIAEVWIIGEDQMAEDVFLS